MSGLIGRMTAAGLEETAEVALVVVVVIAGAAADMAVIGVVVVAAAMAGTVDLEVTVAEIVDSEVIVEETVDLEVIAEVIVALEEASADPVASAIEGALAAAGDEAGEPNKRPFALPYLLSSSRPALCCFFSFLSLASTYFPPASRPALRC
jgi:hypothetical protein